MIVKRFILLLFVSLFSFATSYETLKCFVEKYAFDFKQDLANLGGEEKNTEQEKPDEKPEKLKYTDDFSFSSELLSTGNETTFSHLQFNVNFSSADYSQVIYSPPELLL